MTRVLALALARNSGWAVVGDGGVEACGSWSLLDGVRTTGKHAVPLDVQHVLQVQLLRAHVQAVAEYHGVDVVAIEREFGRGAGSRLLVSLYTAAQEAAYKSALPCLGVRIGDWRKWAYGTSRLSTEEAKGRALQDCEILGVDVPDTDAAEAVQIGRYVRAVVRIHPVAVPATQPKGIAA